MSARFDSQDARCAYDGLVVRSLLKATELAPLAVPVAAAAAVICERRVG